jgi:hypothetical protein
VRIQTSFRKKRTHRDRDRELVVGRSWSKAWVANGCLAVKLGSCQYSNWMTTSTGSADEGHEQSCRLIYLPGLIWITPRRLLEHTPAELDF